MKNRLLIALVASFFIACFLAQPIPNSGSSTKQESAPQGTPSQFDGEQWLPDFPYRKNHTIHGSPGAGTDYRVIIRVRSGSGADSGDLVHLNSSLWSVTDSVRFTDDDGVTLLDYWKESIDVDTATYWVELNDNLNGDVMIYLYYGNDTAPSLSNGSATFLTWDDFDEDYSLGDAPKASRNWVTQNLGASDEIEIASNPSGSGTVVKMYSDGAGDAVGLRNSWANLFRVAVHYRIRIDTRPTTRWDEIYSQSAGGGAANLFSDTSHSYELRWKANTGDNSLVPQFTPSLDIWYSMAIKLNDTMSVDIDEVVHAGGLQSVAGTWGHSQWQLWGTGASLVYIDDFFVTKWVFNEPEHGAWGLEEEQPDTTPPSINTPSNFEYESGSTGNSILWTPSDDHPSHYEVLRNGSAYNSSTWDGFDIEIYVDGLHLGLHNFTIIVYDEGGNNSSSTVFVTVVDTTSPTIDHPSNINYFEGNKSVLLTWHPFDYNPQSYSILMNGAPFRLGLWNSSLETISIQVGNFSVGLYNIAINVTDVNGQYATDQALVTVEDGTAPILDSVADVYYGEGQTGNIITWTPTDANPSSYEIMKDGITIQSGLWNSSGESIVVDVDGYAIGTYNITIVVHDIGGNSASDQVSVIVFDAIYPSIPPVQDIEIAEGSTGNEILWNPLDLNPSNYTIFVEESVHRFGVWNSSSETISISIDRLSHGVYNYTLLVMDLAGHSAVDEVMVIVSDQTLPIVNSPTDLTYNEGTTGHSIEWNPTDLHPLGYVVFRNTTEIASGTWNSSLEAIGINVDGLIVGVWNFTLIVIDIAGNTVSDTVLVTVVASPTTTTTTTTTSTTTGEPTTPEVTLDPQLKFTLIGVAATVFFGIIGLLFKAELVEKKRDRIGVIVIAVVILGVIVGGIWLLL